MNTTTNTLTVPQYLTVEQVADALQVSKHTLYKWWRAGHGPRKVVLRNGSFRVHPDWLDDYMLELELAVA